MRDSSPTKTSTKDKDNSPPKTTSIKEKDPTRLPIKEKDRIAGYSGIIFTIVMITLIGYMAYMLIRRIRQYR